MRFTGQNLIIYLLIDDNVYSVINDEIRTNYLLMKFYQSNLLHMRKIRTLKCVYYISEK